jgi:hypothetical protein
MCEPKEEHNLLPLQRTTKTWVVFGKVWDNLGAHPSSGPICHWQHRRTKRLDNPINTPMKSHDDWHKEDHKARGVCPRTGRTGLRDVMLDGRTCSFGCTGSMEGHNGRLSVTIHEGVRHTHETWHFAQVILGVPIRARAVNQWMVWKK